MPAPLSGREAGSVRARLADALSGAAAGIRQTARAGHRLRQRRAHRPPPDRTGLRDHGRGHVPALLAGAQAAFPDHRWIAADMRRMPLNETFHGLIAWHSFFHLKPEDQRPLFATFARLAAPGAPLMFTSGTTLGKRSGNSKDSRCITAAWTARSIAICWKPTVSKWCDMSSGTRNAAARMSGWPGVAAPSRARRVSRASRQSRRDQSRLMKSCVSRMNQGRFSLSPSPDWMVRRRSEEAGALFGLCAEEMAGCGSPCRRAGAGCPRRR